MIIVILVASSLIAVKKMIAAATVSGAVSPVIVAGGVSANESFQALAAEVGSRGLHSCCKAQLHAPAGSDNISTCRADVSLSHRASAAFGRTGGECVAVRITTEPIALIDLAREKHGLAILQLVVDAHALSVLAVRAADLDGHSGPWY